MYAAVKIYVDPRTKKKKVDLHGLKHVSSDKDECIKFLRSNHYLFTELSMYNGVVVKFNPSDFPNTMELYKKCPSLCICTHDEAEAMAKNIVFQ